MFLYFYVSVWMNKTPTLLLFFSVAAWRAPVKVSPEALAVSLLILMFDDMRAFYLKK